MERGEVWWVQLDERRPVVLLSDDGQGPELHAIQIVAPATPVEKRGFVILSGEQALDPTTRQQIIDTADPGTAAIGIEVSLGTDEGLPHDGVVRLALPRDERIFCTWMITLTAEDLLEQAGSLSPEKLRELTTAIDLAGHPPPS